MYLYNSYPHKLDIKLIYPSYNIEGIQKTLNVTSFVYHNYSVSMEAVYKNIEGNIHFIHQTDDLVYQLDNPYNFEIGVLINLYNSGRYMCLPK